MPCEIAAAAVFFPMMVRYTVWTTSAARRMQNGLCMDTEKQVRFILLFGFGYSMEHLDLLGAFEETIACLAKPDDDYCSAVPTVEALAKIYGDPDGDRF